VLFTDYVYAKISKPGVYIKILKPGSLKIPEPGAVKKINKILDKQALTHYTYIKD
jgi:hypothetical protein